MAHEAKWLILLTRTNPDVPKHKGLTMFILPMDTPGITVEPVPTMGTEKTNATFYDNVRVGDEWVLGQVDEGLKSLEAAMLAGYEDYAAIRADKNLDALRGSPRFGPLLDKYDEPVVNWKAIESTFSAFGGLFKKK